MGIERGRRPDATVFDAAVTVIERTGGRRAALCEQQRDIGFERGLIVFDSEVVVSPVVDQVIGECVLRVQRIGGDVFAVYVDRL